MAIKRFKQKVSWAEATELREVKALKKMNNHVNVMKIKEMSLKDQILCVVFEHCDMSLFQEMQQRASRNQPYSNEEVRDYMHQALSAVDYMHRNGFMHRDLKPENFLVTKANGIGGDV